MLAITASSDKEQNLGNGFAQEAISGLYNGTGLPRRIADIQALGVLSLYYLGSHRLNEAKRFAGDFGAAIIEQWRFDQPIEPDCGFSGEASTCKHILRCHFVEQVSEH